MDITESLITETSLRYNIRSINNEGEKKKSLERKLGSEASDRDNFNYEDN
jgi:hypothetical protein